MFFKKQKTYLSAYLFMASILTILLLLCYLSTPSRATTIPEMIATKTKAVQIVNELKEEEEPVTLIEAPILFPDLDYSVYYDIESTKDFIEKLDKNIAVLQQAIESAEYTENANEQMRNELIRLQYVKSRMSSDLDHLTAWESEHYYAAKVWEYLMQRGYGEVVTSAILGNMMVETAGGTLNLRPIAYSPSGNYYGLCQWSIYYYPGVKDLSFEHQLDYLTGDMPYQFNTFGKCYKAGFDYEDFLAMTDPEEAAIAFAKVYERCASFSYSKRESAARIAYDYFDLNS